MHCALWDRRIGVALLRAFLRLLLIAAVSHGARRRRGAPEARGSAHVQFRIDGLGDRRARSFLA